MSTKGELVGRETGALAKSRVEGVHGQTQGGGLIAYEIGRISKSRVESRLITRWGTWEKSETPIRNEMGSISKIKFGEIRDLKMGHVGW